MSDDHYVGDELEARTGGRVRVVSYESFDALMEDQRAYEQEANQVAHPLQQEITWGDYAISKTEDEVTIWGQIVFKSDHVAFETEDAETDEEKDYITRQIDRVYDRGYRFGHWSSRLHPEGEWGTKHVATLWKVTKEEYEAAKDNGWEAPDEVRRAINARIAEAMPDDPGVQRELAHQAAVEEVIQASAVLLWEELNDADQDGVSEEFMRGVVTLGMYITDVNPDEADRWLEAIRLQMIKLSIAAKEASAKLNEQE